MNNVLRLAIVDPNDASRSTLKKMLLGMEMVWLEAECSRYEFFNDVVLQTNPDIGIISLDGDVEKALNLVTQIGESAPDCQLLVVSSSTDGNLILQAMRAGAKEFLTQPVKSSDLVSALTRISSRRFGKGESKSRGCSVIAVAGSTGGVGCTSVAVNMGCIIAKEEKNSVVLVDLDLCLGDADVLLDTIADYTLVDAAKNISRLDASLLKRSLAKHSSGLYLLPRPIQIEDIESITSDDLHRVISLMKATFTHIVVDLSKNFNNIDRMALELADHVLLVTQLDLPCLRNVVRLLMSFKTIEGLTEKIKVIVNRSGLESSQISIKKAQETIGREIYWQLPNDYRTMVEVRNNGVSLIDQAPKAALTQAMIELTRSLVGELASFDNASASKKPFSKLLNMWGGGGAKPESK